MTDRVVRIALDEAGFRDLVSGKVVVGSGRQDGAAIRVELILSDIGWDRITMAISDAILAAGNRPPAEP